MLKFILLIITWSSPSFAQLDSAHSVQQIAPEELMLMGRPVESKNTHRSIALHCEEFQTEIQQCVRARFVLLDESTAFLFGPELQKINKKTFQDLDKKIKKENKLRGRGTGTRIVLMTLGVGGLAASFFLPPGLNVVGIGAALGLLISTGLTSDDRHWDLFGKLKGFGNQQKVSVTRDQDGWNWSIQTKKVSEKNFNSIKNNLENLGDYR